MWKFLLFLVCMPLIAAVETQEFDAKDLTEFELHSPTGKVNIVAVNSPKATVAANKIEFGEKCRLTFERTGHRLLVRVKKEGFFSDADCNVDFEVKVPKATDLELKLGAGKVNIQGTQGELDFKVGSGDVTADGRFRALDGKTGAGNVEIKGLTGSGDLNVGSGRVSLTYAEKPTKGELDVKIGTGPSTLYFPKGSKLRTDFKSGTGRLTNEIGDVGNADFEVSAKSGTGDMTIKAY